MLAADAAFAHVLADRTALVPRVPPYRPGEFCSRGVSDRAAGPGGELDGHGQPARRPGRHRRRPTGRRPGPRGCPGCRVPSSRGSWPASNLGVHADSRRQLLVIEQYRNDGLLTAVTEAGNATDGYARVLDAGLVSRLDHGAYLGRELGRAGHALRRGARYEQDAAPG